NKKELEDFGENFEGFKGKEAVLKLLEEKRGQIKGAFYKEGLGDIDLVWGEAGSGKSDGFGLAKIVKYHPEVLDKLDDIIKNTPMVKETDNRYNLENENYKIAIRKDFEGKKTNWLLTAFEKKDSIARRRTDLPSSQSEAEKTTSANANEIIPQRSINLAMEKFHYDEKKAKDLLEWHKDSSPLTKDENGLPKVFYHYTNNGRVLEKKRDNDFEVFTRKTDLKEQYEKIRPYDTHQGRNKGSRYGIYFTENEKYAQKYATLGGQETDLKRALESGNAKKYEVFLNIKNPLDLDTIITEQNAKEIKQLFAIKNPPKHIKAININDYIGKDIFTYIYDLGFNEYGYKSTIAKAVLYRKDKLGVNGERDILNLADFLSLKGYDGVFFSRKETGREFIVFNSNQIKHIDNKGSYTDTSGKISKNKPKDSEAEHKYFNEKSENIYYSNPHLGAGLVGGVLNGLETDEDGNITGFDPAKFAMGFLGGSLGSKAVSKGIEWRANKVKKAYPNIAKDNPALMEQIAKRDLLTYAKNESANALTRFLNKNKLFDSTRGLFAGEKALLNEAYAPHKARLK
ncbi:hypothetical protein CUPS3778_09455, partial [Campylobacter upsaliensis]|nr:hypothetical protein [Campylobacter upsaliensis]